MANNAMQVYEKLGLRNVLELKSNAIHLMNINRPDLKPISGVDLTYFEQKYHVCAQAIEDVYILTECMPRKTFSPQRHRDRRGELSSVYPAPLRCIIIQY